MDYAVAKNISEADLGRGLRSTGSITNVLKRCCNAYPGLKSFWPNLRDAFKSTRDGSPGTFLRLIYLHG